MRSLSILRIVWDWPPPWTGLSPGPYDLTLAQSNIGNKLSVLTGGWPLRIKEKIPQVNVVRLPSGIIPKLNASVFITTAPSALILYILKQLTGNIDIIHAHGHLSLFFSIYKKLFGWLDTTPLIIHLHHVATVRYKKIESDFNGKVPLLVRTEWFFQKLTERLALRYASKIVVVSESMKKELLADYTVNTESIYVLVNGVNTDLFQPNGNKRTFTNQFSKTLLFVGNLNQRKNPDLIIKALIHLPEDWGIVFIGPDHMNGELQILTNKMQLSERVTFEGEVHNRELAEYIRAADILVLPSSSEGFPKVVLESLACGVPVVASGFDAGPVFENMITYIDELTPEGVAKAILMAENNKSMVNVSLIQEQFSWNSRALELQEVYELVLDQK